MKFALASSLLVASAANAPYASAFSLPGKTRTKFGVTSGERNPLTVSRPTVGNVSRRKIKAWHNLKLEPWVGLKSSLKIEDGLAYSANDDDLEVNGIEAVAIAYEAKSRSIRNDASEYLTSFEGETGASVIYSKLVEHGVDVVNGFSGGAVLPLLDQFSSEHPRHGGEEAPIRWITNSNESSAGHIAEGVAKSSKLVNGKAAPGVVLVTSGPGVTNLITPLQDGICDGVPMLVLAGQAASNAPEDAFQFAPAVDLTKPCTKWSYQIKSAVELPFVLDYAFYISMNGRPGPVFIDLPKDLQIQKITKEDIDNFIQENLQFKPKEGSFVNLEGLHCFEEETPEVAIHITNGSSSDGLPFHIKNNKLEPVPLTVARRTSGVDSYRSDHTPSNTIYTDRRPGVSDGFSSKTMDEMMSIIKNARKPLIIAGQGCNDSSEELTKFAESLQIPVTTTLHALGCFDERHPLALNMLGMHGHPTPNFMIQESDLIICVGSRFDDRITGNMGEFIPEARKAQEEGRGGVIHVDIRLSQKGKRVKPNFFVHSTAKTFLKEVNSYIDNLKKKEALGHNTKPWLSKKELLEKEYAIKIPTFDTIKVEKDGNIISKTPMSAQHVISTLNKLLLEGKIIDDSIFTTGVGIHQMVAAQLITWTKTRQMISSGSLGTMGVSLGYCIGAKLANPTKICISIDGDGSFNMTFTELKTVAEEQIPIKIMILDNEGQMMVEYWQRLFCGDRLIAVRNEKNPDYCKLAESFDIKSLYCDNVESLEETMHKFLYEDVDKPVLFHVKVNRTPCLPLVAPGQALDDMILSEVANQEVDETATPS